MEEFEDAENFPPVDSPDPKPDVDLLMEQNANKEAVLKELWNDPEFAEAMEAINSLNKNSSSNRAVHKKPRRKDDDSPFIVRSSLFHRTPLERRKSSRLRKESPLYTEADLVDETSYRRGFSYNDDFDSFDEIVYKPKKPRTSTKRTGRPPITPVEEVTQTMLDNIARKVSGKVYSDVGTSCHQCRQKTLDQKTVCRNVQCVGVRGQFCGVCLENRYGEDVGIALKDSSWYCPVCRGICNCSFCRAREGKRPTGILTPLAVRAGYKSVKQFLDSLRGLGDYATEIKPSGDLLGFTDELKFAQIEGGVNIPVSCSCSEEKLREVCVKKENELDLLEMYELPVFLLGFRNNFAHYNDGSTVNLNC